MGHSVTRCHSTHRPLRRNNRLFSIIVAAQQPPGAGVTLCLLCLLAFPKVERSDPHLQLVAAVRLLLRASDLRMVSSACCRTPPLRLACGSSILCSCSRCLCWLRWVKQLIRRVDCPGRLPRFCHSSNGCPCVLFSAPTFHVPRSHAPAHAEQVITRGFGSGARDFLYAKSPAVLAWTTAMKLG